jgi:hypothetical protein
MSPPRARPARPKRVLKIRVGEDLARLLRRQAAARDLSLSRHCYELLRAAARDSQET